MAIVDYELPAEQARDSIDQGAVWRGAPTPARTFLVHNTFAAHWAIRSERWLLIDAKDGAHTRIPAEHLEAEGFTENPHAGMLFDLTVDIGQRTNVFGEHPGVVDRLRKLLDRERSR